MFLGCSWFVLGCSWFFVVFPWLFLDFLQENNFQKSLPNIIRSPQSPSLADFLCLTPEFRVLVDSDWSMSCSYIRRPQGPRNTKENPCKTKKEEGSSMVLMFAWMFLFDSFWFVSNPWTSSWGRWAWCGFLIFLYRGSDAFVVCRCLWKVVLHGPFTGWCT